MSVHDNDLWHIGGFSFPPWALLLPVVIAALIWGLGCLCTRFKWMRIATPIVPVGLGAWLGIGALTAPHGYAAGYSFGGTYILTVLTALGAGLLLPWRRSRRSGLLGLAGAATLLTVFYAVYLVGYGLDLHAWKHKERIAIPPTAPR